MSGSLQDKNKSVEVAFYDKVSPNNVPDRLQKWISIVEADGGKVLVEPPPNEFVARNPLAALSLVGTLITSIKGFANFNSERIYETAKGRDAVISLERNNNLGYIMGLKPDVAGSTAGKLMGLASYGDVREDWKVHCRDYIINYKKLN